MNCIIIDDDKVSRILFEKYTLKTEFLTLLKSFDNAIDAVAYLNGDETIDLIFLDIEMPEMTGMDLIKNLPNLPQIIIISAKEKYAIEAIEYNVTDYLLKPVSFARFYKAVTKAFNKHKDIQSNASNQNDGIFIKNSATTFVRLGYDNIIWIESMENYLLLNTWDEKFTIHFTMKSIENKLPFNLFSRIHRSYIINVSKISLIEDNNVIIKTKEGSKILPIAKGYKEQFLKKINLITK